MSSTSEYMEERQLGNTRLCWQQELSVVLFPPGLNWANLLQQQCWQRGWTSVADKRGILYLKSSSIFSAGGIPSVAKFPSHLDVCNRPKQMHTTQYMLAFSVSESLDPLQVPIALKYTFHFPDFPFEDQHYTWNCEILIHSKAIGLYITDIITDKRGWGRNTEDQIAAKREKAVELRPHIKHGPAAWIRERIHANRRNCCWSSLIFNVKC